MSLPAETARHHHLPWVFNCLLAELCVVAVRTDRTPAAVYPDAKVNLQEALIGKT